MSGELFQVSTILFVATVPPIFMLNPAGLPSLRIEWRVDKTPGPTPDTLDLAVYNLDPAFRGAISAGLALPVPLELELHVGWGALPERLFRGQVWRCRPEQKTGKDVVTRIEAGSGARSLRETPPDGGASLGYGMVALISVVVASLGLRVGPGSLAAITAAAAAVSVDPTNPANYFQFTADGDPGRALDALCASIGLSWGVSGDEFVVYQGGLRNDIAPVVLTPLHGLLSWEVLDDGAVAFQALAQPRVEPGAQITILGTGKAGAVGEPIGGAPLRVDRIEFRGSTDGESVMSGTARKLLNTVKTVSTGVKSA